MFNYELDDVYNLLLNFLVHYLHRFQILFRKKASLQQLNKLKLFSTHLFNNDTIIPAKTGSVIPGGVILFISILYQTTF